jgi:hypothetical protein
MHTSLLFDVASCENVIYTKNRLDVIIKIVVAVVVDMGLMPQGSISPCNFFFNLVIVTRGIRMIDEIVNV